MTSFTAMIVGFGVALGGGVLFLDGLVRVIRSGRYGGSCDEAELGGDRLWLGVIAFYIALFWAGIAQVLS